MRLHHKDEGFTLIELMVVVLIIGILVAIAIPVFMSAKANAQKKSCFANQRTIEGAGRTYEAEFGTLPTTIGQMVPTYLAAEPKCPSDTVKKVYGWSGGATGTGVATCQSTSVTHLHYSVDETP